MPKAPPPVQVPLADGDPLLTDLIGEREYSRVCLRPINIETEIAPGTFVQYYCDRQPQHWNDKVAGVPSIEDCALACTRIETCKGTFWKSHDGTCWWSDQEFLVESDGADSPCTVVPGSVYMTVREGYTDGCVQDLIECHKKTQVLEAVVEFWKEKDLESAKQIMALTRENEDLRKQRDDLEEKLTQNCVSYVINGRNWAACEQKPKMKLLGNMSGLPVIACILFNVYDMQMGTFCEGRWQLSSMCAVFQRR
ncbi:hypothetical protein ANOM_007203 [Aspergillus nomiae NRRL 13137]|uniref:Apple domain-containing protein n=1 Tax=Aspergillus nomiae NRRL (strain ATCC 15546 / NRRL 13137 / CBS 260.88 / M93) TaxID=1509407 RepID=A0A0L1IW62_ASPN3|nr:uncharacterized protein ANOM_007203 [Aspergillus nomiae NRRL 13137]KNG83640.1 hypothetical protein ANOM_007203 [Aspergillus nomiae NRRL 13137]